ncbi:LysR family transcriptional regulator [Companilactobacillus versmoldensis]|uniref:LysR family transcriptional regulator n=1 Tax=Companilactobacillus versmoldensis DSM 14857 = KCTC 3814 TaxID=1423815 RepID=A0A0R1SBS5_9LACO|nr:LysR family transcriptional regulator [Companilactobacillus versmoldensis]KRL66701.1 LysR family transcriptional regulator [Companilactobacillus versmoldensis DSM 14857 = KCTC 3814]
MELRVLNYFLMIAREENITRAAKLLHISQPTLSRQIAGLEQELGVKLFTRQSHQITLTEEGLLLRRRAEEIQQLTDKTISELSSDKSELSGEIAIGSGELLAMNELAAIMTKFHQQYPLVTFTIRSDNSNNIKLKIEQGILDLGMLIEPINTEKYDFIEMSDQESWGILVRDDSPLAKSSKVSPENLQGQSLIMSDSSSMNNEITHWLGNKAKDVHIVSRYNLLYNSTSLVTQGLGILLCLKLESHFDGLTFVPLNPDLKYHSVLAWKADQISSRTVVAFIEFAKKYLRGISHDEK